MISYIAPLAIILALRFAEEAVQHIKTIERDSESNNKMYARLEKKFVYKFVRAGDLRVGDVIKIKDERVPADVLILSAK